MSKENLKLNATSEEDLKVISAHLQDSITQVKNIAHLKKNRIFLIQLNRFMHIPELNRMGAKINIIGNKSKIQGPIDLYGAEVMATDLRASVSLVLAGLAAKNKTVINRVYHLDRGYEDLEKKLRRCKASILRVNN